MNDTLTVTNPEHSNYLCLNQVASRFLQHGGLLFRKRNLAIKLRENLIELLFRDRAKVDEHPMLRDSMAGFAAGLVGGIIVVK